MKKALRVSRAKRKKLDTLDPQNGGGSRFGLAHSHEAGTDLPLSLPFRFSGIVLAA